MPPPFKLMLLDCDWSMVPAMVSVSPESTVNGVLPPMRNSALPDAAPAEPLCAMLLYPPAPPVTVPASVEVSVSDTEAPLVDRTKNRTTQRSAAAARALIANSSITPIKSAGAPDGWTIVNAFPKLRSRMPLPTFL